MPLDTGTYPRLLGRYVRVQGWLSLSEAIRKMTSLPAAFLKLKNCGLIRLGAAADLVLFISKNGELVWDQMPLKGVRTCLGLSRQHR